MNSGAPPIGVTAPFPRQEPARFLINSNPWAEQIAQAGLAAIKAIKVAATAIPGRKDLDKLMSDLDHQAMKR